MNKSLRKILNYKVFIILISTVFSFFAISQTESSADSAPPTTNNTPVSVSPTTTNIPLPVTNNTPVYLLAPAINSTPVSSAPIAKKPTQKIKDSTQSDMFYLKWPNQIEFSVQGAGTLNITEQTAPELIQTNVNEDFLRNHQFLNLQYYFLQFPSFFKWSLKASAGWTRNYDNQSTEFIPLSIGGVFHLYLIDSLVPFFEWGYSVWNINFDQFSSTFFYWGAGLNISFSLFKPSLRYTLPDEYTINDMGLNVESRWSTYKSNIFINTLHVGLYLRF